MRWHSANTTVVVHASGVYGGELSAGNFVVKVDVSSQDDLYMWNEATVNLDTVSTNALDEEFVCSTTSSNAFVFSQINTAGKYDLWVWDVASGARRISNTALDHTFVASFRLDNR